MSEEKPILMEDTPLLCLICYHPATSLGDDPAHMVHRIETRTRIIYICVSCADDLRSYLTGKKL